MGRLSGFGYREITKRLKKHGFVFYRQGLLVTSFMLLAVGSKIIAGIFEDGRQYINELQESFSDPLAPTLYFFTYIIGYIVIW